MKKLFFCLSMLLSVFYAVEAQQVADNDNETNGNDIAVNIDVEAIARAFGEAANLDSFEMMINNPEHPLTNLDLNLDGYVDYLRVLEMTKKKDHLVIVQAVLNDSLFQDVVTFDIEIDEISTEKVTVLIIGDPYIFGDDYVLEVSYGDRPLIFDLWWNSEYYYCYESPWYWEYYPTYYFHYPPFETYYFRNSLQKHYWKTETPKCDRKHNHRIANSTINDRIGKISHRDYALLYGSHNQRLYNDSTKSVNKANANSHSVVVKTPSDDVTNRKLSNDVKRMSDIQSTSGDYNKIANTQRSMKSQKKTIKSSSSCEVNSMSGFANSSQNGNTMSNKTTVNTNNSVHTSHHSTQSAPKMPENRNTQMPANKTPSKNESNNKSSAKTPVPSNRPTTNAPVRSNGKKTIKYQ